MKNVTFYGMKNVTLIWYFNMVSIYNQYVFVWERSGKTVRNIHGIFHSALGILWRSGFLHRFSDDHWIGWLGKYRKAARVETMQKQPAAYYPLVICYIAIENDHLVR